MPGSININISIATYERLSKIKNGVSWSVLLNTLLDNQKPVVPPVSTSNTEAKGE